MCGWRAANSHSVSEGSRLPAHLQKALASFHETCTTGWERMSLMPEPGPSGDRQLAPGTANQWDASLTDELVIALASSVAWSSSTKDQPKLCDSVW